jgi:hypothetical protein
MHKANRPEIAAVTNFQIAYYNVARWSAHRRSGLQYKTGPRRGQQLADLRLARLEELTAP